MARKRSLFDRFLASCLPLVPKSVVQRVAARYVAGDSLDAAVERVRALQRWGACVTLDVLGEEIHDIARGEEAKNAYLTALDAIHDQSLDGNVSVKLTAFGLKIDAEVTYRRLREVVEHARRLNNFVRIDMEDSSVTTATLSIFRRLREEGFDNVGVVLQAYLRRTAQDVAALAALKPSYRLCKGIYVEPEDLAFQDGGEVNANFLAVLRQMLRGGSYVGIATHDHVLVDDAKRLVSELGLERSQFEFQMLLGVDEAMARSLVAEGHRLRVYVPYGADWYAYCIRRLKENPKIGRYVFLGLFKRG